MGFFILNNERLPFVGRWALIVKIVWKPIGDYEFSSYNTINPTNAQRPTTNAQRPTPNVQRSTFLPSRNGKTSH